MSRYSNARIWIVVNLLLPGLGLCAPFAHTHNKSTNKVSVTDTANGTVVATQTNSGITVNLVGTRVYVVTSRNVSVIDTTTDAVIATIPPSSGNGIAVNAAGTRVDVAKELLNSVSVIETATNAIIAEVVVAGPSSITGVAVNPAGTRVYIADPLNNVVIVLDTASNTGVIVAVGGTPYAIAQSIDPASTSPATTPDLNQHGLTGSWYEPATSGQGFAVEVFPNQSPGNGQAFVSWFTFDPVSGGAERQRWYTLQGQVVTGQPNASLTIYQNTGGNFNAPPATNAQAVGTATLSFATCSSGNLSYSFTDGTGRTGTIPLTRLLPNVTCSVTTTYPTNADFALSGSWYGWRCNVGAGIHGRGRPEFQRVLLVLVYVYAERRQRRSRWTTMVYGARRLYAGFADDSCADLRNHRRDVRHTDASWPETVAVGTGTMTFQSCSAATFSYNFTGGTSIGSSGTITLGRVGPVPPGCTQ